MPKTPQSLTSRAYQLLSRREYSRRELSRSLAEHAESQQQLEALLDQLVRDGYQSDERFTDVFVRSRIAKGQGPVRIANDLKQKGIDNNLIMSQLAEAEVDWFEQARHQRIKRFGMQALQTQQEKSKCMRFLLYRGFNHEQSRYATEAAEEDYQ